VAIVVQARMRSTRLPGKALKPLAGRPLLAYVLDRVFRCERTRRVLVATSENPADDAIETYCATQSVTCVRGDEHDVARRFERVVDRFELGGFVRVCADSPLIDPVLIDEGLERFHDGGHQVVTNNLSRTYPAGQTVEIVDAEAFRAACMKMTTADQREHVTRYIYDHPDEFDLLNMTTGIDYSDVKLSVDTPEDFDRIADIVDRMTKPHWHYRWSDIVGDLCAVTS
jgi:spore coat polysaccharide biosynthesis protein SpsF